MSDEQSNPGAAGNTNGRTASGQFAKGHASGPGRPRLATAAQALDVMGMEAAQELMQVVIDQAREGNLKAAEMVLSRVWPARRERPVVIAEAPRIQSYRDLAPAQAAVTAAVLEGEVGPREAAQVAKLLETDFDFERRIHLQRRFETIDAEILARHLRDQEQEQDQDQEK